MERANRGAPGRLARSADLVHRACARHVSNVVTTAAQPATQVRIFPIQEEALVESASGEERIPAHQQACTRQPIHDDARRATSHRRLRRRRCAGRREETASGREAHQCDRTDRSACPDRRARFPARRRPDRESAVRRLHTTGSASSTARSVDVAPADQPTVRVQQQQQRRPRRGDRLIDRTTESDVAGVANERGLRKRSPRPTALPSVEALSTTTASHGILRAVRLRPIAARAPVRSRRCSSRGSPRPPASTAAPGEFGVEALLTKLRREPSRLEQRPKCRGIHASRPLNLPALSQRSGHAGQSRELRAQKRTERAGASEVHARRRHVDHVARAASSAAATSGVFLTYSHSRLRCP